MNIKELTDKVIELKISTDRYRIGNNFHGNISGRVREIYGRTTGFNYWIGDFCFGPETEVVPSKPGEYTVYLEVRE